MSDLNNLTLPSNKEVAADVVIKHFEVNNRLILAGTISFLLATFRIAFLNAAKSIVTIEKEKNMTDVEIYNSHRVEQVHFILDVVIFVWCLVGIAIAKFKTVEKKLNLEECLTLLVSIPIICAVPNNVNSGIIIEFQWVIKLLWFYLAEFAFDRNFNDLRSSTYTIRIFKYGIWAYVTVHGFACLQYRYLCPKYWRVIYIYTN